MATGVRPLVGDLFLSEAQTLVNTVNTVGVMGKGIALQFKNRFPDMYKDYVQRCERGQVVLGKPYLFVALFQPWILNFPTKDHWRSSAKLKDITAGLEYVTAHYREWGITSMAVPPLGCGEGGLEWRVVGPTLYRHLSALEIPVELYAPFGTPPEQLDPNFLGRSSDGAASSAPLRVAPASVALVEILARIQAERYHWPTGRVSFQKIAYFATQAGIPTSLTYVEGSYGPFSPDFKRVQSKLENNGLLAEERFGRMFVASPGPTFSDARESYGNYLKLWEEAIGRVVDLLLRFDTHKAEVAATVHFATVKLKANRGHPPSEMEVLDYVMAWKRRRNPPLDRVEVATAIRHLYALHWIEVAQSPHLPLPQDEPTAVA